MVVPQRRVGGRDQGSIPGLYSNLPETFVFPFALVFHFIAALMRGFKILLYTFTT